MINNVSGFINKVQCDRCQCTTTFDLLSAASAQGWNTYKIMDLDIILCPKCSKEYEKMILNFMKNEEGL